MRDGSVSVEQGKRKGWKIILLLQLEISRISDGLDKEVLDCSGLFSYLLGKTAWRSTGLYLPEGHTAVITCPCLVVGAGLKVSSLCLALVYTHVFVGWVLKNSTGKGFLLDGFCYLSRPFLLLPPCGTLNALSSFFHLVSSRFSFAFLLFCVLVG